MHTRRVLCVSLCFFTTVGTPILTAQKRHIRIPVEDLASALRLADDPSSISPDGKWLAYTVQDPRKVDRLRMRHQPYGVGTAQIGTEVWITNTQPTNLHEFTENLGAGWGPVWSPDGEYLAFYSRRSGSANIWVYDTNSRHIRQVSAVIVNPLTSTEDVRWTSDSKSVMTKVGV